jgi:ABC-type transport system substrate-binding protein
LDINLKSMFSVADYWQRIGTGVETEILAVARLQDREYRAVFPGFAVQRNPSDLGTVPNLLRSTGAALPENNWRGQTGNNRSRYVNPEYDALLDRYATTIPFAERVKALGEIIHHQTDQLPLMSLFYDTTTSSVSTRLKNISGGGPRTTEAWNAHLWDVE